MKLIVIGATGRTGCLVVQQALSAGHKVTAIVRPASQLDLANDRLQVVRGDVLEPSSFQSAMDGQDAVISALGVNSRKPTTVYSEGMDAVIQTMQNAGVRRLLCLSASALTIPANAPLIERLAIKMIVQRLFGNLYKDMERMEEKVRLSGLDWTLIRPPRLTNGPMRGKYRTSFNEPLLHAKGFRGISRADLAHLMLALLDNTISYQARVEISY